MKFWSTNDRVTHLVTHRKFYYHRRDLIKPIDERRRQLNKAFAPFATPSEEEEYNTMIINDMVSRGKSHSYKVCLLISELDLPNAEETGAHHNSEALQVHNLIKISSQQQRVFTDKD